MNLLKVLFHNENDNLNKLKNRLISNLKEQKDENWDCSCIGGFHLRGKNVMIVNRDERGFEVAIDNVFLQLSGRQQRVIRKIYKRLSQRKLNSVHLWERKLIERVL